MDRTDGRKMVAKRWRKDEGGEDSGKMEREDDGKIGVRNIIHIGGKGSVHIGASRTS